MAFKNLRRALCLRNEHIKPAHIGDTERLRLHHERRARGIVDDVEHTRKPRELPQINGRHTAVRIHADGRGVHNDLRIRVAVQIAVVVFSAAGDDRHAARTQLIEHGADRRARAAAAENERLFALD